MLPKKLKSIFTDNMNQCIFTMSYDIERHHIFSGTPNKHRLSEYYGFIAPLRKDLHPNGVFFQISREMEAIIDSVDADSIDEFLKRECEKYYIANYGHYNQWMEEFGKNYLTDEELAL